MTKLSSFLSLATVLASLSGLASAASPVGSNLLSSFHTLQARHDALGRCEVLAHTKTADLVMGYTDQRTPAGIEMPDNMRSWLECVDRAAQFVNEHPELTLGTNTRTGIEIRPLLGNIMWNQSEPFCDLCPAGTPTGCVATAVAQVLYYYRYPEHGFGKDTYTNNGITHTVNFGNTYYKWDQMFDYYDGFTTEEQNAAVAELSYHCGVALHMDYAPEGSGAWTERIPKEMTEHFGYNSKAATVCRMHYTYAEWCDILIAELQAGRPVIFAGNSSDVGHCFVIDGINSEGLFHVNWGWGGYYNGYFDVGILEPEGHGIGGSREAAMGYCINQRAVVQFCPEEGVGIDYCPISYEIYNQYDYNGQWVERLTFQNNSGYDLTATIGCEYIDEQGNVAATSANSVTMNFGHYPSNGYWQWNDFNTPISSLPDGRYALNVYAYLNVNNEKKEYDLPTDRSMKYNIRVENGKVGTEVVERMVDLELSNYSQLGVDTFAVGKQYTFEFDVTNHSEDTFVGTVKLTFYNVNDEYGWHPLEFDCNDLKLLSGETQHAKINATFETSGDWDVLALAYSYGYSVSYMMNGIYDDFITTLFNAESPAKLYLAEQPKLITEHCETNGDVEFGLNIDNVGGNFSDMISMQLFTNKSNLTSPRLVIENPVEIDMTSNGNEVTLRGNLTGLKGQTKYYARAFYRDQFGQDQPLLLANNVAPSIIEVKVYNASGIEQITEDEAEDAAVFDLMGRRVAADHHGIAIQKHAASLR